MSHSTPEELADWLELFAKSEAFKDASFGSTVEGLQQAAAMVRTMPDYWKMSSKHGALETEVERLRKMMDAAADRDRAISAEKDDLAAEVERLRFQLADAEGTPLVAMTPTGPEVVAGKCGIGKTKAQVALERARPELLRIVGGWVDRLRDHEARCVGATSQGLQWARATLLEALGLTPGDFQRGGPDAAS